MIERRLPSGGMRLWAPRGGSSENVRNLALFALVGVAGFVAGFAGCYDPKLGPNLRCASPPAKECPDGYRCSAGTCVTNGSAGTGTGGAIGTGGSGTGGVTTTGTGGDATGSGGDPTGTGGAATGGEGTGGAATGGMGGVDATGTGGMGTGGTGTGGAACVVPRPSCTPEAGTCDPFCKSGCTGCREKCAASSDGSVHCAEIASRLRMLGETCQVSNAGQPTQTDDCDAGLACVEDCLGTGHCFEFCRSDADCPSSSCTRTVPGTTRKICEVPFKACDPVAKTGCSLPQDCYLISPDPTSAGGNRTVCDCSRMAGAPGEACSDSRECAAGLVCPTTGVGAGFCRYFCTVGGAACAAGTCRAYGANFGYCF